MLLVVTRWSNSSIFGGPGDAMVGDVVLPISSRLKIRDVVNSINIVLVG